MPKAKIFRVRVVGKEEDEKTYDLQAKDDTAARKKAVALWVRDFNRALAEMCQEDERNGDKVYRGNYSEKDVDYCEVELFVVTDG